MFALQLPLFKFSTNHFIDNIFNVAYFNRTNRKTSFHPIRISFIKITLSHKTTSTAAIGTLILRLKTDIPFLVQRPFQFPDRTGDQRVKIPIPQSRFRGIAPSEAFAAKHGAF